MILFLDTAGFESLRFALVDSHGKIVREKKQAITHPETERALHYLQEFLVAAKVAPAQLSKICIVSGPGSFTGIRAGFAHALAFSLALGVPIYHIKKEEVPKNLGTLANIRLKKLPADFSPDYGREPNIT